MKPLSENDFTTKGIIDPAGVFTDLRTVWQDRLDKDKPCLMVFTLPWDVNPSKAQEIIYATQLVDQDTFSYGWMHRQRKKCKRLSIALSLSDTNLINYRRYHRLICEADVVAEYQDVWSVDVTKNKWGNCGRYYLNSHYIPKDKMPQKKENKSEPPYDLDDFLVQAKTVLENYEYATSKYHLDQTVSNTMLVPAGLLWWLNGALSEDNPAVLVGMKSAFNGWDNIMREVPVTHTEDGVSDPPFRVPVQLVIDIITQYKEQKEPQGWYGYEKLHTPKSFAEAALEPDQSVEDQCREIVDNVCKELNASTTPGLDWGIAAKPNESQCGRYITPGKYVGKVSTSKLPKSEKPTGVDYGPSDTPADNKYHGQALGYGKSPLHVALENGLVSRPSDFNFIDTKSSDGYVTEPAYNPVETRENSEGVMVKNRLDHDIITIPAGTCTVTSTVPGGMNIFHRLPEIFHPIHSRLVEFAIEEGDLYWETASYTCDAFEVLICGREVKVEGFRIDQNRKLRLYPDEGSSFDVTTYPAWSADVCVELVSKKDNWRVQAQHCKWHICEADRRLFHSFDPEVWVTFDEENPYDWQLFAKPLLPEIKRIDTHVVQENAVDSFKKKDPDYEGREK